jgi:hypothetical protein
MEQTVTIPANATASPVTYYVRFKDYIDTSSLSNNIEGHKAGGGSFTPTGQPSSPATYFDSLRLVAPGGDAVWEAWISMTIQTPSGTPTAEISLSDIATGAAYTDTIHNVEYNGGGNHSEWRTLRYYKAIKVNNGFMLKIDQPANAAVGFNILYVTLSAQSLTFPFSTAPV